MIYRQDGKKWTLPDVLYFERAFGGYYYYKIVGYREPKAGEYFVSGADPQAYLATNDLSTKYLIAKKTAKAKLVRVWQKVGD